MYMTLSSVSAPTAHYCYALLRLPGRARRYFNDYDVGIDQQFYVVDFGLTQI